MSFVTPQILAVVNASSDSFSGNSVEETTVASLVASMLEAGADAFDVGGQSLRTDRREIPEEMELQRLMPVLEVVLASAPNCVVSVDTYRASIARRAVDAGATIINDPSGLSDPEMMEIVAEHQVDLVLTYNVAPPKRRLSADEFVQNVVENCLEYLNARLARLAEGGIPKGRILLDLGVDLGKSPAQSVEIIRNADLIRSASGVERVLWALSRKDFVGAVTNTPPSLRDAGTLGALSFPRYIGRDLVRVHNVKAVHDMFAVRAALEDGIADDVELSRLLRHD